MVGENGVEAVLAHQVHETTFSLRGGSDVQILEKG